PTRVPPQSTLFPYTTLFRSEFRCDSSKVTTQCCFVRLFCRLGKYVLDRRRKRGVQVFDRPIGRRQTKSSQTRRIVMFKSQNDGEDRKSTRLNSSHVKISYAV